MNIIKKSEVLPNEKQDLNASVLKNQTEFLKEENAKLESVLKHLGLDDEVCKLYKHIPEEKDFNKAIVDLSLMNQQRKQRKYTSQMKYWSKVYDRLNKVLNEELDLIKYQLDHSDKEMKSFEAVSKDDIKIIEAKTANYNKDWEKMKIKYDWLSDPKFDLLNIEADVRKLKELQQEKHMLQKEIDKYQGLKPDLLEATRQLAELKAEYKKLNS